MSLGKLGQNPVGNLGRSSGSPQAQLEELQKKEEAGDLSADDVQGFINSGGFARALAANPQSRAMLQSMLQNVASNASRDQAQLDSLAQRFGLGQGQGADGMAEAQAFNGAGSAQSQAFNPLAGNSLGTPSRIGAIGSDGGVDAQLADLAGLGGGGGFFEDKIFAIMCKVVEQFQKQIEQRLEKLQSEAQAAQGNQNDKGGESRNIEFEKIKYDMQKLSQMQQAMSNVLNSMDELAKSAIHHIKAG